MQKLFALLTILFTLILISCQKEVGEGELKPASLEGTYKFKYISAKTSSTVSEGKSKITTTTEYTSTQNSGIIRIGADKFIGKDISYVLAYDAHYSSVEDGKETEKSSYPFSITLPPFNNSATYRIIGTDSISFPQGTILETPMTGSSGSNVIQNNSPQGGKFKINGNLLTITQQMHKDSTFQQMGILYRSTSFAIADIVLEKQ